jgi:hypothetical protein
VIAEYVGIHGVAARVFRSSRRLRQDAVAMMEVASWSPPSATYAMLKPTFGSRHGTSVKSVRPGPVTGRSRTAYPHCAGLIPDIGALCGPHLLGAGRVGGRYLAI